MPKVSDYNDNIKKLRELTDKLCKSDTKDILINIKNVIADGITEISETKSTHLKNKCYEKMFLTINNILEKR